jgi:4-hydroxy-tetrahydrodipicolinate synthase
MLNQEIHYITPAVTPLCPDGQIDFESCATLYNHLIAGGVDGIVVLGSIGEFFAFTMQQKKDLVRFAVETVQHRVPVIVGTTSMVFDEIVELSNYSIDLGAEAVMIIPPYYFYHTDESVIEYYGRLAEEIQGDVYLYNFPDRTGYEISPVVVRKLAEKHANIIGIKDTIGGVDHTREIIKQVKPVRPEFRVYSGFDDNFAHNVLSGGNGCIAGLSNLYPELTSAWVKAAREEDYANFQAVQQKIDKLMNIYAVGKPFVPFIKQALVEAGIIKHATASFPMPVATDAQKEQLKQIMTEYEKDR